MTKTSVKSVAAAARAGAKRAEKARAAGRASVVAGRTVVVGTEESAADPLRPAPEKERPEEPGAADTADVRARENSEDGRTRTAKRRRLPRAVRMRGRPRLLRGLLAVVTLAAVAATALLGWEYREAERTRQARSEAPTVARKAAPKILSYDYRHLKRDFEAARSHLTGSFRKEFAKTTEKVVTPTAEKYHGVVKATVAKPPGGGEPAVSVVSASPEKVVVLLFMNQVTESKKLDQPRMDLNRVRMTLVDTSGGWKVSAVDAL